MFAIHQFALTIVSRINTVPDLFKWNTSVGEETMSFIGGFERS